MAGVCGGRVSLGFQSDVFAIALDSINIHVRVCVYIAVCVGKCKLTLMWDACLLTRQSTISVFINTTFISFGVVFILSITVDKFNSPTNSIVLGILASLSTLYCTPITWSTLFYDTKETLTPTMARFVTLMILSSNILTFSVWLLFTLTLYCEHMDPALESDTPIFGTFLKCIYTTVFVANGNSGSGGIGSFVDNHWSLMIVSFFTNVYVAMVLRPIVFAELFADIVRQKIKDQSSKQRVDIASNPHMVPLLKTRM